MVQVIVADDGHRKPTTARTAFASVVVLLASLAFLAGASYLGRVRHGDLGPEAVSTRERLGTLMDGRTVQVTSRALLNVIPDGGDARSPSTEVYDLDKGDAVKLVGTSWDALVEVVPDPAGDRLGRHVGNIRGRVLTPTLLKWADDAAKGL